MTAGFDRSFGQAKIEEVGNGGEGGIVSAHEFGGGFFIGGVELNGANLLFADDAVDAGGHFARTLPIGVGKRDRLDLGLPSHIVSGGRAHHARTNDQEFHECTFQTAL